jgi:hypothetical protein
MSKDGNNKDLYSGIRQEAAYDREQLRIDGRIREKQISEEARTKRNLDRIIAQSAAQTAKEERRATDSSEREAKNRAYRDRQHRERLASQEWRHRELMAERDEHHQQRQEVTRYSADKKSETALTIDENRREQALQLAENQRQIVEMQCHAQRAYIEAQQRGEIERMTKAHELMCALEDKKLEIHVQMANLTEQGSQYDHARHLEVMRFEAEIARAEREQQFSRDLYDARHAMLLRCIEDAVAHQQDTRRIRLEAEIRAEEDRRAHEQELDRMRLQACLESLRRAQETDESLREADGMVDIRDRERALIQDATLRMGRFSNTK